MPPFGGKMSKQSNSLVLAVNQDLVKEIGFKEAIIVGQINYWLSRTKHFFDDKPWVYNSYEEWGEQFSFWSQRTIRRVINSLEKQGIILSSNFNESKTDRTKWYSLNFEKLPALAKKIVQSPCGQSVPIHQANTDTSINKDTKINLQRKTAPVAENGPHIKLAQKNITIISSLEEWNLTEQDRSHAIQTFQWAKDKLEEEIERFKTYYASQPHKRGRDFGALWKMWCVRAESFAREREKRVQENKNSRRSGSSQCDVSYADFSERMAIEKEAKEKISIEINEQKKNALPQSPNSIWLNVSERLISTIGASVYVSWFKDIVVEKIDKGIVVLKARGKFAADYISTNFLDKIVQAFERILKTSIDVSIVI